MEYNDVEVKPPVKTPMAPTSNKDDNCGSWYSAASGHANKTATVVSPNVRISCIVQAVFMKCSSPPRLCCTMAGNNPTSVNMINAWLTSVTNAARPKASGVSSRVSSMLLPSRRIWEPTKPNASKLEPISSLRLRLPRGSACRGSGDVIRGLLILTQHRDAYN